MTLLVEPDEELGARSHEGLLVGEQDEHVDELLAIAKSLGYGVVGLVALLFLAYILQRRRSRNRPR